MVRPQFNNPVLARDRGALSYLPDWLPTIRTVFLLVVQCPLTKS
jgi:hypothetical protein